jgi:formylglycine-generating enzyme required for sulfatase activity
VTSQEPNPFGLYGMLGNVWEWCQDGYDAYVDGPGRDPVVQSAPTGARARRGGSYGSPPSASRSASRSSQNEESALTDTGLRPARAFEGP